MPTQHTHSLTHVYTHLHAHYQTRLNCLTLSLQKRALRVITRDTY